MESFIESLRQKDEQIADLKSTIDKQSIDEESFVDNDVKTNYFTGIAKYYTLQILFSAIKNDHQWSHWSGGS